MRRVLSLVVCIGAAGTIWGERVAAAWSKQSAKDLLLEATRLEGATVGRNAFEEEFTSGGGGTSGDTAKSKSDPLKGQSTFLENDERAKMPPLRYTPLPVC